MYIYFIIACIVAVIYIGLYCYASIKFKTFDDIFISIPYGILAGMLWPGEIIIIILFLICWLILNIKEKIKSFRNKRK